MNLMNQRLDLQEWYDLEVITAHMLKAALQGPVFVCPQKHQLLTDPEKEFIAQHVMHDKNSSDGLFPRVVPFDVFRLSYPDGSYSQWWFDMARWEAVSLMFGGEKARSSTRRYDFHMLSKMRRQSPEARIKIWVDYKRATVEEESMPATDGVFKAITRDLVTFLFDVMSGTSTTVKVTDDQPGRSVQWRLNREHYLVLNHKQAQTIQHKRRGVTDQDLVRGAHWRRAHLRRLMSDKFKNKKGQLVPVRKAWVGPEEWRGHDGKIYKVSNVAIENP